MAQFAELLLPLAIKGTYTYRIPEDMRTLLQIGCRVLVPFGQKKIYTAIVVLLHDNEPKGYRVKEIISMIDPKPILRYPQLKFWQWISDYYLCTLGEVYKAALPSGLKVESETFISVNPDYEESEPGELTDRMRTVLDFAAQRGRMQVHEITRITEFKNVESIVNKLLELGAIHVAERVIDNYRAKTESCVRLNIDRTDDEALHRIFDEVKRAKKQEALLLSYLDLSHWLQKSKPVKEVTKDELLKRSGVTQPVLAAARQRGVFEVYKREVNRFADLGTDLIAPPTLTDEQTRAYSEIHRCFKDKSITLLHGVTSSGKTSIYMHLIKDTLEAGKQALYLVPEIALTTQLTRRLRKVFGDKLLIYHSKFSDNERVDIWKRLLDSSDPCVVIGVRSSIFLPYSNLGLIVVDEEHDTSYKQQDPAPRYHARSVAIMLAQQFGAKTLLGSATPSAESWNNAETGKYGLVELDQRFKGIELPEIKVVDVKDMQRRKMMYGPISPLLLETMQQALAEGEQVILFQNRRGFAPMIECRVCGWVPKCENCDVSLTLHKNMNLLTCHYCGYTYPVPKQCPNCESDDIRPYGYGTEKIEEKIMELFPGVPVARMDLDTTRSRNAYERIINDFSAGRTKILIGTQMISKGLDFDHVRVVGILNADSMLNIPDFRAYEHAFTMMSQVAGRAGRKGKRGLVILQTKDVEQPVIKQVVDNNWRDFYSLMLAERSLFHYPPFYRLIYVYLKHKDEDRVDTAALEMGGRLRQWFGARVLGPDKPSVSKVRTLFIRKIMLKLETGIDIRKVHQCLHAAQQQMEQDKRYTSLQIYYDVDPS
mgnify:CR=1 FL=1